jgi:hypothetical protein
MKINLTHLTNTNPMPNTNSYAMGGINQPSLVTTTDITSSIITSNSSGVATWNSIDTSSISTIPIQIRDDSGTEDITVSLIRSLKKNNLIMFLKILVLEGKFTKEETVNILNMLESKDEASKELAATILKNEGYEYIF